MPTPDTENAIEQLERILHELAAAEETATYGEIGLRLEPEQPPYSSRIRAALRVITSEDASRGQPLRASLVVGKRTGLPGKTFFEQAQAGGRVVERTQSGERTFAINEQRGVFDSWRLRRPAS